jgi:hypothetical protein
MRKCGRCTFGGPPHGAPSAAPWAACVLVFSRTSMHGDSGVLRRIDELAASEMVPRASTYCKSCRRQTWLCEDSADLGAAALDFWHQWHTGKRIARSLAPMRQKLLRVPTNEVEEELH